jgi:methionyl-tRNA formyltransferase
MTKYKIIFFGGDRLLENGPLSKLSLFLKKKKIKFLIITDHLHLKKKVNNNLIFKDVLKKNNYEFICVKKLNFDFLKNYVNKETIGFSINSIWKFNEEIINLFKGRLYNYHAADLPTERGAGNITWRILMKKKKNISINIHEVAKEYDTGCILKSKKISIPRNKKLPFEHLQMIEKIEKSFLENFLINCLNKKNFTKIKQFNGNSFYWPRINSDIDGLINWHWKAHQIVDFIKGFSRPYNGAFTFLYRKKINIFNAEKIKLKEKFHPFQNGIVFREHDKFIYIAAEKYALKVSLSDIAGIDKTKYRFLGKRFLNE